MNDFLQTVNHSAWMIVVVASITIVSWKLCRFLDQATRTSEARARDYERNFAIKNRTEDVLRDAAWLCRVLITKIERETPPPRL